MMMCKARTPRRRELFFALRFLQAQQGERFTNRGFSASRIIGQKRASLNHRLASNHPFAAGEIVIDHHERRRNEPQG
jgi:hypothetical protein